MDSVWLRYLRRRQQWHVPPPSPPSPSSQNPLKRFITIIVRKVKEFAAWISQSISKLIPEKPFVIKLLLCMRM
ncbi:hypothetical protein HanIR_Chr01g0038961 [Helianthus annuus]|nr:hypothetical protein HanIR_Chr01g0038961 [Helianthus annuus]